jgi:hypothetical protein
MSLDPDIQTKIVQLTNEHWVTHVQGAAFAELISG